MIGLFGIVAPENEIEPSVRRNAFNAMVDELDVGDFRSERIEGQGYSIGITKRKIGDNKDLSIRRVSSEQIVAFNGYGKIRGENRLYWADAMIDRLMRECEKAGKLCFEGIEGSFECIVIKKNRLYIVSDRFGSKRLYFYNDDKITIFGPDVICIIKSGLLPAEKDIDAVLQVLMTGFLRDDRTLLMKVRRFPFASVFEKDFSRVAPGAAKRYWNMPRGEGDRSEVTSELIEEFTEKMSHAVHEVLALDDRVVLPLSGGLDSRTIACFVAQKQKLKTITYDLGDELVLGKKVCSRLGGKPFFFTNKMLTSDFFREELYRHICEQKIQAVPNQYFYAPLFKQYFQQHSDLSAIYDGVYMDILFSAPYTYNDFQIEDYMRIYCAGLTSMTRFCRGLDKHKLLKSVQNNYQEILEGFEDSDGVAKSQLCYVSGRLRRYVSESLLSRENFCYVYKPGYNYDLMDFGFSLALSIRKSPLYVKALQREFPEAMRIRYKDSYGNRKATAWEKVRSAYMRYRLKVSYASRGLLKFYPFQAEYFFLELGEIERYKKFFRGTNYLEEIIDGKALKELAKEVTQKQYLFNFFQRLLFMEAFYARIFG